MLKLIWTLALLCVLAACAPATKGSSASSPFDAREELISVPAAGTYYASYQVVPQAFGLDPDDFATAVVKNPRKGRKTSSNITSRFSIVNSSLPENWSAKISSAKLIKEVTKVSNSTVWYSYWLDLTFKVDVPEGVELGMYRETLSVKARGEEAENVRLNFFVRKTQVLR